MAKSQGMWRLATATVVLAVLGGLLATRGWWSSTEQPPDEQQTSGLAPLVIPELKADLDPAYRKLMVEAQEVTRRVAESFPEDAEAVAIVAMLHHLAHDRAGEEKCWRRCLELDESFSRAYQWLALRATEDGDYAKAEALMRQAMDAGAEHPEFPSTLATALMQQGKLDVAARVLEADLRSSPQLAPVRILLGQVYLQLGENEKAKEQFQAAIQLFPTSLRAYHGLIGAYTRLGLDADAKRCRVEFDRLKALEQEAEYEIQKGRQDELMAPQWVAEILMLAGKVYLAHEQLEDAERFLQRAAELDATDTQCREALSSIYDQQGRHEDAIPIVEELTRLEPENLAHYRSLGILHGRLGHLEEAEKTFQELCRLAPQNAVGYAGLAEIYLRANKALPKARTLATQAVQLQPTAWNYFILASICEKNGDEEAAQAAIQQARAIEPHNPLFQ